MAKLVRTLSQAAAFVDQVGIALVFPREGVPLGSLWTAVAGDVDTAWVIEQPDGTKDFSPEMERVWSWKDELAAERLVCSGKHLRGWAALVSLKVLPALYALTGLPGRESDFRSAELSGLETEVAEAALVMGPISAPDVRNAIGVRDTPRVNRAIDSLQRKLILTKAGTVAQKQGWPAGTFDVLARRYPLGKLPTVDEARRTIAECVNAATPAELARATGWTRRVAAAVLDGALYGST